MTARVQSVAVVGSDASLWLTAAALKRALGSSGLRVQAVELQSRVAQVDAYVALPTLGLLHRLLGLDEKLVLSACRGAPMVGQRFSNWAKAAPPFLLAFDDDPPPGNDLPFIQYWAKGALEGLRVGLGEFSLGSACARVNAVPVRRDDASDLSASYGYHLDAPSYVELVKQFAFSLGVERTVSELRMIDIAGDKVEGIDLADGTRITADLYVDASGPEARLIGRLSSSRFEPWKEWLPCDRILAATGPRLQALPAFSQISAFQSGWVGLFPLQDRTAVCVVYSSAMVSDSEAVESARVIARMPIAGDAVVTELRPGAQQAPWIGNCVAIGGAAMSVDPVDAAELHVTHGCVSHLISLFPATSGDFPEAQAYNSAIRSFGFNLRDFQAAHYLLNRRFDENFWDKVRDAPLPPSLARKSGMFAARAIVPLNDHESFNEQSWAALLTGCGLTPRGYDPRLEGISNEEHVRKVQQRLRSVAMLARQMPNVEEFLGLHQHSAAQVRQ